MDGGSFGLPDGKECRDSEKKSEMQRRERSSFGSGFKFACLLACGLLLLVVATRSVLPPCGLGTNFEVKPPDHSRFRSDGLNSHVLAGRRTGSSPSAVYGILRSLLLRSRQMKAGEKACLANLHYQDTTGLTCDRLVAESMDGEF